MQLVNLDATESLAARLAPRLAPGDAVLLEGPLGAGKSAFARALLRALSQDPGLEVPSPTFTLVQSYNLPGGHQAHHFDLYRLSGPAEIGELGWDEAREGIVIVEWPDRLGALAPDGALRIALDYGEAPDARRAELSGWDEGRLP
ncbi:MAG: tRNA (adenosine(37)-N6)-threonylcarbamoyltransferase complex ATPase subunit type 1 TsaE [Pseudomonadota bacterium]